MTPSSRPPQVGAPDPERDTSPILDEDDEIEVEPNAPEGACYYNGARFDVGAYVLSGTEVLRCEAPGVWVREGERAPGSRVLD